ncbi:MAG: fimbrillin family protein [Muribaculaceae bacterium]|nr:fimbrillin family protein [Muribaculaceae bacterium]
MKYLTISIIATVAIILAACSKEADTPLNPPEPNNPTTDKLEIKISPSVVDSRATDFGFENGDKIGLYVVNYNGTDPGALGTTGNHVDNMGFAYNGSWKSDSPIYWKDKNTHADFYLYYPYAGISSVSEYPFSVRTDQSTLDAYKASDFMTGKATDIAPTASAISLPANHVMSRIVINLQAGNGFTAQSLASASVSVKVNGVKCSSTVDIATGAVTPTGSATSVIPLFENNAYKAYIVPQTVDEGNLITVSVDGLEYNVKKALTFESAKTHKCTVTLNKTADGVDVSISPWTEDGTDNGGTAK